MSTTTVNVQGMTCEHCVNAVRSEVARIAGVTDVQVDLDSGAVTISSEGMLDDTAVRAAVDEAGYELVQ
ncbi:MAG: heavy-metal-associated domain-containing protein [Acidimicrobiia bacterium]|nr:heavy-metal-associated domain-containing protein [Acidimicrobiia bacterium]